MSDGSNSRRGFIGAGLAAMATAACSRHALAATQHDVRDFGAKGDGLADDAPAIQRALDAAASGRGGTVILPPGTYRLCYRPSADGDGLSALTLPSHVALEGTDRERCVLKLADDQMGPGTYARIIASRGDIVNASLRRFMIDGNRRRQRNSSGNISGAAVLLGWKGRCADIVVDALTIRDVIGQGVMLQASVGRPSRNLRITGNLVERTSYIGIQCSQFDGIEISGNRVFDCADNGIDLYGDDTIGHSTTALSRNAKVERNEIARCSIGIFLETVADTIAADNQVEACAGAGIRINRIHGEPKNLLVTRNRISGTPSGIAVGGDTGGVTIRDNVLAGFSKAGIEFGYNVSRVNASGNRFEPATRTTPIILGTPTKDESPPQRLSFIRIQGNRVPGGHAEKSLFVNRYRSLWDVEIGGFIMNNE